MRRRSSFCKRGGPCIISQWEHRIFSRRPNVMKAMQDACGKAENYKYSLADLPELLEAVKYRYEKRFGVHIETDEVMSV